VNIKVLLLNGLVLAICLGDRRTQTTYRWTTTGAFIDLVDVSSRSCRSQLNKINGLVIDNMVRISRL